MANNLDEYATVIGEAFKIVPNEDKGLTNFTVKSYVSGKYINATLWDNSHKHIKLENGDAVIVNGKLKKTPKKEGDGFWLNLSVSKIAVIPLDGGIRNFDDSPAESDGDEPDVL